MNEEPKLGDSETPLLCVIPSRIASMMGVYESSKIATSSNVFPHLFGSNEGTSPHTAYTFLDFDFDRFFRR